MLGLAYTCGSAGFVASSIFIFLAAAATFFTLHLFAVLSLKYADVNGHVDYFTLTSKLSPKTSWLVDFSNIMICLGSAVAYIQGRIGNLRPSVL